jgi:hypothetical protein
MRRHTVAAQKSIVARCIFILEFRRNKIHTHKLYLIYIYIQLRHIIWLMNWETKNHLLHHI